ncbi:MAG: GNAT family N-acetyltransferase [Saprospiraceae bacterium]|nr:GNAT family N-acetyltransferase [Saprospiraceae bacterium]
MAVLLEKSFPQYPEGETFLQQAPDFRVVSRHKRKIVSQVAVDFRMIRNGKNSARVFCLSDVCVHPDFQSRQLGTQMLKWLESEAQKNGIDFILLTSGVQGFYYKLGYRYKENIFKWLLIRNGKSMGLLQRRLRSTVMVKKISQEVWSNGIIDLAGPIF